MKFYSEILKTFYDDAATLEKAEADYKAESEKQLAEKKRRTEERAARAKVVEDAYRAYMDAEHQYLELRDQFVKDYGSFHMTITTSQSPLKINSLFDLFGF